jgi:hypothetical protein
MKQVLKKISESLAFFICLVFGLIIIVAILMGYEYESIGDLLFSWLVFLVAYGIYRGVRYYFKSMEE